MKRKTNYGKEISSGLFDFKKNSDITILTLKQISRGRFYINEDECEVKILYKGEVINIIVSNDISVSDFKHAVLFIPNAEPSTVFLCEKIDYMDNEKNLIQILKEYREKFYVQGKKLNINNIFKLYSRKELEDPRREAYHATWIDYHEQLEHGDEIYDVSGINGIFAMPINMVLECMNEECIKRYGDRLFRLEAIDDCFYLNNEKEIIGERFRVIEEYDMNSIYDIQKIVRLLVDDCQDKNNVTIQQLYEENSRIAKEKRAIIDNQVELLERFDNLKLKSIQHILLGLFLGIIISLLIF